MKITLHTHHSLKVLAHLAANPDRLSSIGEIAQAHGISHNHLMKVVHGLRVSGFVDAVRGRCGGIRLARPAREITLGELVRHTEKALEPHAGTARGSDREKPATHIFERAFGSFFSTLNEFTVADIAEDEASGAANRKSPQ